MLLDASDVLSVLKQRVPEIADADAAAATAGILQLLDGWEDVTGRAELDGHFGAECSEVTHLADLVQRGAEVLVLQRKKVA